MDDEEPQAPELASTLAPIDPKRRAKAMRILRGRGLEDGQIEALVMFATGNRCADVNVATEEYLDMLSACVTELGKSLWWYRDQAGKWSIVIGAELPFEESEQREDDRD